MPATLAHLGLLPLARILGFFLIYCFYFALIIEAPSTVVSYLQESQDRNLPLLLPKRASGQQKVSSEVGCGGELEEGIKFLYGMTARS